MTALVLSVPHTGTRFVMQMVLAALPAGAKSWPGAPRHRSKLNASNPDVVNWHINDNILMLDTQLAEFDQIFVPLRDPWTTLLSWKRRNRNKMDGLPKRLELLATFVDELKPWYLPIDTANRDTHVGCARAGTGLDLDPGDWSPVGHDPGHPHWQLDEQDRELIRPCLARNEAFFGRFYDQVH